MFWEVPVLSVITELRSRAILKNMGRFDLQILYARAMTKLWEKIEKLKAYDDIRIADFGTRRRHSFLWQDWCIQAMIEGLDKYQNLQAHMECFGHYYRTVPVTTILLTSNPMVDLKMMALDFSSLGKSTRFIPEVKRVFCNSSFKRFEVHRFIGWDVNEVAEIEC